MDWEAFDKLHVVRRLRQIVGKRWKIQLNFTDARGYLRNEEPGKFFDPLNPSCVAIAASQAGFKGCIGTVRELTAATSGGKTPGQKLARCHAGYSAITLPISIAGRYLGSIFADGFILEKTKGEQLKQIKSFLVPLYSEAALLEQHLEQIPVLNQGEVSFLTELLSAIIEEVVLVQKSLVEAKAEAHTLQEQLEGRYKFSAMIGKSPAMQRIYRQIEQLADASSMVLIQGENGTGKELIARALHFNSGRKAQRFLAVNCGALNENLLESELFGHVKGSFTNALKDKLGVFEAAGSGTLFLDEIGDVSPGMQVKLLRVLQDGTFTPVGGTMEKTTRARVVCATNKDLLAMIAQGRFREDLYYRLNVINIVVPPLRERSEDLPLLIEHFLKKQGEKHGQVGKRLSHGVMQKLLNHSWPGNIRELENEIERLVVLGKDSPLLTEDNLSPRFASIAVAAKSSRQVLAHLDLKTAITELEKEMIIAGLARLNGNKSRLAIELGISRANLISKVEKYGIVP